MILVKLIGILALSVTISSVFVIVYIKALSVLNKQYGKQIQNWILGSPLKKFLPNISNQRGKKRQDSKIEVCCIYCFDNVYNFLKPKIIGISRVFWNSDRKKENR